jgi:Leucine-rich repeat (LRR) protein
VSVGRALSNIQRLNLSHNQLKSLQGLEQLQFLEKIDLSFNLLTFVDEVISLVKLKYLEDVVLTGNPIATLYANTETSIAGGHRHPMWETLRQQQQRIVWQDRARTHQSAVLRLQEGNLYRLMVFAYFYPELSSNGHYRNREMICLDGEVISELENEIIK